MERKIFKQVKVSFILKLKEQNPDIENLEGYWFYEENLRVKEFEAQFGITPNEEQLKELKEKLKVITNKGVEYKLCLLIKYFRGIIKIFNIF
ncbi:hypothetical protein [Thermodesulfobacterium hveragerdense]|uniref:hypothetical protein n=1 Tax=Thermodesulfobacterium hveragerdense TaxID=53424 RepID=UPI00048BA495|nr:hypothetical protein [Thermodesulfobacterium hveragerdense]